MSFKAERIINVHTMDAEQPYKFVGRQRVCSTWVNWDKISLQ